MIKWVLENQLDENAEEKILCLSIQFLFKKRSVLQKVMVGMMSITI